MDSLFLPAVGLKMPMFSYMVIDIVHDLFLTETFLS